jgi:hypothetical protein
MPNMNAVMKKEQKILSINMDLLKKDRKILTLTFLKKDMILMINIIDELRQRRK